MIITKHIDMVSPGDVLAKSIYDAESKLLLREGVKLDQSIIEVLNERKLDFVDVAQEQSDTLQQCESCYSEINLQSPISMKSAATTWACRKCNAIYFGRSATPGTSLDPVDVLLEPTRKVTIPKEIDLAFSKSWCSNGRGSDRRQHERHIVTLPVTVVPLSSNFCIMGESVLLNSQDISQGGICLKTMEYIDASFLYIELQLTGRRLRMLVDVVRLRQHGQVFEMGCKFISRVGEHSTDPLQMCSVPDCGKVAYCEVLHQDVSPILGKVFYEIDEDCPYLCKDHIFENEHNAEGKKNSRSVVSYPYTNQQEKQGFTIYKPLADETVSSENTPIVVCPGEDSEESLTTDSLTTDNEEHCPSEI